MADLSTAETILNNATKTQSLIKRLQAIKTAPIPYVGIHLFPDTKAHIRAFQEKLQANIDELTTQREKTVELVKHIPDQTARTVLELRYGLTGSGRGMTWVQIEMKMPYSAQSLFRYHRKGLALLEEIMESYDEHDVEM